jgi:hypothetical protein
MLDKKFFLKYGPDTVAKFRKHTFIDAKDVFDKPFKKYSTEYGDAKRANKFKRQATEFASSTAPVLTSDLLRDFKMIVKPNNKGFGFGTVAHGGKVERLAKMGRVITADNQPVPDDIEKWLLRNGNKYIDKKLKKIKGFKVKIGK